MKKIIFSCKNQRLFEMQIQTHRHFIAISSPLLTYCCKNLFIKRYIAFFAVVINSDKKLLQRCNR